VIKIVEFISASTAGIVRVSLGWEPDFAILIQAHAATNPNIYLWANSKYAGSGITAGSGWPAALSLLITGTTGVVTRDTTGITVWAGGTTIASVETNNSSPKHIDDAGVFAAAGTVTKCGLAIPADHQTNSGRNLLVCFKEDSARFVSIQA
jgi:hypothetical protein